MTSMLLSGRIRRRERDPGAHPEEKGQGEREKLGLQLDLQAFYFHYYFRIAVPWDLDKVPRKRESARFLFFRLSPDRISFCILFSGENGN